MSQFFESFGERGDLGLHAGDSLGDRIGGLIHLNCSAGVMRGRQAGRIAEKMGVASFA